MNKNLRFPYRGLVPLAALAAFVVSGTALAHSDYVGTSPRDGSTVNSVSRIVVTYSGPIGSVDSVTVKPKSGGGDIVKAFRADPNNNTRFFAQVKKNPAPGAYTVAWTVRAADGHPQQGSSTFRLRAPANPIATAIKPVVAAARTAARDIREATN